MNVPMREKQDNFLFYRMAVEFLTERLGIVPSTRDIDKVVALIHELIVNMSKHRLAKIHYEKKYCLCD